MIALSSLELLINLKKRDTAAIEGIAALKAMQETLTNSKT